MKKYRKKPVIIEAFQFTRETIESHLLDDVSLPEGIECTRASFNKKERTVWDYVVRIDTLEGEAYKVKEGDWIIKGIKGEFYPCKPDIFEATYEEVP
jgi:hypothetical protein